MSKSLPERPNLEQLKKQAKELFQLLQAGEPQALERFREHHPTQAALSNAAGDFSNLGLADAQLVIAREFGFATWAKLKDHVESILIETNPIEALKTVVLEDDTERAAAVFKTHPGLKTRLNEPLPEYGFGTTPLLAAVERRSKRMVDLLLKEGADINARSQWWAGGFGVLDDDHGLADFLIERGAVVDVHAASRLGMLARLKELISMNPKLVHARGGDGQTPLHFAPTVEIADYLLSQGADIDARDVDHESTPAQYMVRERQDVARFLIKRGCQTDILMASAVGDLALARKLIDADPACVRMSVSAEYFPKRDHRAGGTIYIWTLGQYKTPHMVAREFGHEDILRLLLDSSPEEVKLAQACALGAEDLFQKLLSQQPNLAEKLPGTERQKLADAAQNNNTQAVKMMLSAGWPVDARGQHGGTALHWAAWHGNEEMIRVILSYNPPLECIDRDFAATPLGWAIHGSENGWHCRTGRYPATVEALLGAGAKAPEKIGGTAAVQKVLRDFGTKHAGA